MLISNETTNRSSVLFVNEIIDNFRIMDDFTVICDVSNALMVNSVPWTVSL